MFSSVSPCEEWPLNRSEKTPGILTLRVWRLKLSRAVTALRPRDRSVTSHDWAGATARPPWAFQKWHLKSPPPFFNQISFTQLWFCFLLRSSAFDFRLHPARSGIFCGCVFAVGGAFSCKGGGPWPAEVLGWGEDAWGAGAARGEGAVSAPFPQRGLSPALSQALF